VSLRSRVARVAFRVATWRARRAPTYGHRTLRGGPRTTVGPPHDPRDPRRVQGRAADRSRPPIHAPSDAPTRMQPGPDGHSAGTNRLATFLCPLLYCSCNELHDYRGSSTDAIVVPLLSSPSTPFPSSSQSCSFDMFRLVTKVDMILMCRYLVMIYVIFMLD
jgi:hypothetical protein